MEFFPAGDISWHDGEGKTYWLTLQAEINARLLKQPGQYINTAPGFHSSIGLVNFQKA